MKNIIVLFALIFSSCASNEYSTSQIEKIKTDMTFLDRELSGYLYRKVLNKDLSTLNNEMYLKYALQQQSPSEKEYIDLLMKKDLEILVRAERTDFVVCVKDKRPLLILCDRANKEEVEKVTREDLALGKAIEGI